MTNRRSRLNVITRRRARLDESFNQCETPGKILDCPLSLCETEFYDNLAIEMFLNEIAMSIMFPDNLR